METMIWGIGRREFGRWLAMAVISWISSKIARAQESFKETYSVSDGYHIFSVQWTNIDAIHSRAANGFISRIESIIHDRSILAQLSGFSTHISQKWELYTISYSVRINPVNDPSKADRVIDIRWTVTRKDNTAEKETKSLNKGKIPDWQRAMTHTYANIRYELSQSGNKHLFTESVLAIGKRK